MARVPKTYDPQLATLASAAPEGDVWLHEVKYDGYRIGCRIDGEDVRLISRRGKNWTMIFPEICVAAQRLPVQQALIDGEVAIMLPDGRTSFQALQNVFGGAPRNGLAYLAFDLLHLDGEDLTALSLDERKSRLKALLGKPERDSVLRFSDHVIGNGPAFLSEACRAGLEGVVSKRRDRPYRSGRTAAWVKSKCTKRQEFVVGGFTDPEGSRQGVGALLLGVYDADKRLVFSGKVGTGFTQKGAIDLRRRLDAIEQKHSPFDVPPDRSLVKEAHWVHPELVAQISFAEWTNDRKVRHASFQGLRQDKSASEVVAEIPERAPPTPAREMTKADTKVAGVKISNPDRTLYPGVGVTKIELARFYETIAEWILPHAVGRPLTLVRCPKGLATGSDSDCFYMKHANVWMPPMLDQVGIQEKTKVGQYLVVRNIAGIISLVQMDVLEIHTWNSTAERLERPDRVVFDLDPGPEVTWRKVVEAARLLHQVLASLGLRSFVKNTGGRGLHVLVPFLPEHGWDECLAFSHDLCTLLVRQNPRAYTISIPKAGREKKILLDYLRNRRTATAITAFSTRARPGAPVSTPLSWDELSPKVPPDRFNVRNLPRRLAGLRRDPWEGYFRLKQRLTREVMNAVASLR